MPGQANQVKNELIENFGLSGSGLEQMDGISLLYVAAN
jgi:hypothetical protein